MDSDQGKLFIGGISWETDEDKLSDYFGNYGQVLQTVVMRDKISGRPRGFGFVVFADPSVLDRVLQEKHTIDGRTVEAKRAMSREDQQTSSRAGNANTARNFGGGGTGNYRTKKIFVGGLPPTLTEEGFRQYFESYGNVTDVVVMYDQATQRPRGFGFVSFDSEEAVDRVLHKTFHDMNGKQVEVKRALPKDANPGGGGRSMVGGGGGAGSGGGYQAGYGASGGNSGSFDGRTESNRYMQSQNAGGGFPAYGSSGYSASGYGYGPANNSMGYGGYGGYGAANPGYGGAAATAYGNPNAPSAGYGSGPPGPARSSWSSQAPSGYGAGGYGNASAWGGSATGGPGSAPTGQSPGGASGYGSQGYGYGGYGGSDGSYANQASYGAVGGRAGSVPNSNASAGGGEMQGGGGAYRGGGGYGDANGASGYGNQGWNDPSPTSGSYGAQANGPHGGPVGYGGGYGGAPTRQAQQQ